MINSTTYTNYLNERQRLLDEVPNKKDIEKKIKKQVKENMLKSKMANGFFKLEDLMDIKEVKKYFSNFVITGDRNIGKTTAIKNYIKHHVVDKMDEFMWLRNTKVEVDNIFEQMRESWNELYGWDGFSSNAKIYDSVESKKVKDPNGVCGHFKAVSTAHNLKSVDFKKVSTIVYDEFNSASDKIKNKYDNFVSLITSIERLRQNLKIILTANFINQNDELLLYLGLDQSKKDKQPLLVFNWISRTIMWFIPSGEYQNAKVKQTLGYRMSLNSYDTYVSQYAGTFKNQFSHNVKPIEKLPNKKHIFDVAIGLSRLNAYSNNKELIFVVSNKFRQEENVPLFVFSKKDMLRHYNSQLIPGNLFKMIVDGWLKNIVHGDNPAISQLIIDELCVFKSEDEIVDLIQ